MRHLSRIAFAAAMAIGGTLLATAPASAAVSHRDLAPAPAVVIDLRCGSSVDSLDFQPPLTLATQITTVTKKTVYNQCSSPTSPAVTSGRLLRTMVIPDACPMLLNPGTAVQNVTWSTGQTSTFTLNRTANISGSTFTVNFAGTVTAGLFAGSTVKQVYTADATNLINCLNGVGSVRQIVSRVALTIYH